MPFQLVPVSGRLQVEGESEAPDVGRFSGLVIALGLQDTDPVSAAAPEGETAPTTEGLSGYGVTYFLVCDEGKSQPVWVAKHEITKHSVG